MLNNTTVKDFFICHLVKTSMHSKVSWHCLKQIRNHKIAFEYASRVLACYQWLNVMAKFVYYLEKKSFSKFEMLCFLAAHALKAVASCKRTHWELWAWVSPHLFSQVSIFISQLVVKSAQAAARSVKAKIGRSVHGDFTLWLLDFRTIQFPGISPIVPAARNPRTSLGFVGNSRVIFPHCVIRSTSYITQLSQWFTVCSQAWLKNRFVSLHVVRKCGWMHCATRTFYTIHIISNYGNTG